MEPASGAERSAASTEQPRPAEEPHWLTLRFPRAAVEEEYRREHAAKSLRPFRTSVLIGTALYLAFGALDPLIIPEALRTAWAVRFLVILPAAAVVFALTFSRRFAARLQPLGAAVGLLAGGGIVVMISSSSGHGMASYHSGLFLVLLFTSTLLRLRLPVAAGVSLGISATYLAALPLGRGLTGATVVGYVVFLLAFDLVGVLACYGIERSARLDFLHRKVIAEQADRLAEALSRVKVLSGLVPVCAWCRRVRDDAGFWKQIEAYLGERTDASFTHGVCPDCLRKMEEENP